MCLWNMNAPAKAIFRKLWRWYLTLTLTDDLDFGTKENVLPYMANVKVFADKQADRPTNREAKNYMPWSIDAGA